MCGFAGIISADGTDDIGDQLRNMSAVLAHRGPDDLGYLCWAGSGPTQAGRELKCAPACRVALAHRRLAVLDTSDAAWQPMSSSDGRYHLVFNGEIYNYVELREELVGEGHSFRSDGDTEVLLAALAQWGTSALSRLVGMFALALLDTADGRMLLARDPFGIKPLYYTCWRENLAFASEIKSLLQLPDGQRLANPQRLYAYLRFGVTDYGARTLVQDIHQLPAGHFAKLTVDRPQDVTPQAYFKLEADAPLQISFDEAAGRLRELFLESVTLHLRSDVPVGACLSGGIDSAAIVAAMRQVAGAPLQLQTVTFVAADPKLDEQRYACQVAKATGANTIYVRADTDRLAADIDPLIDCQDEPFGSTSIYAQWLVFQAASENGIKVMLDGQGADEMLGGYRYFVAARAASLLRRGHFAAAYRLLRGAAQLPPSGQTPPLWLHGAGLLLPRSLRGLAMRAIGQSLVPGWLDGDWFRERGVQPAPPTQADGPDLREQMRLGVTETTLPAFLRYEDRNSMAFSIESRLPFLTPSLVQFVFSLPEEYLVGGDGLSKNVFRRAMRGIVPDEILQRRDKIGFATPEASWLKALQPWMEARLASALTAEFPAVNGQAMQRQWQQFLDGRGSFDFRFWRWANLIRWCQRSGVTIA